MVKNIKDVEDLKSANNNFENIKKRLKYLEESNYKEINLDIIFFKDINDK